MLQIIYVISNENKPLWPYPPHLKYLTALPYKMQNFFYLTGGNVAFHHTVLKFSQCRNKTLPQLIRIADWHTIHAHLQYPNSAVPTSSSLSLEQNSTGNVTEACCWCRIPAICSIAGDVFVFQQDNAPAHRACDTVELLRRETAQFISPDNVASQQSTPDLNLVDYRVWGMLQERVYRSTNPRHGRVAEASCWNMRWISAQRGGRCSWSVAKKTESVYPCRRWSFWTIAVTLPAWHSSCYTSQPVLFRATHANPSPAVFRATNIRRNATLSSVKMKKFSILQGSAVTFFTCDR